MKMYVEMDKVIVPLSECTWFRYDPNGHCIGMLVGDGATTASQCHKEFTSTIANRAREVRWGYTHVLHHKSSPDWAAGYACHRGECNHLSTQDALPIGGE